MTLIPLKLYFNERGRAKLLLAVAKGKKLHDKRESEKKRDWSREKGRLMRRAADSRKGARIMAQPNLLEVDWSKIPAPTDDGGAAHLVGMAVPPVSLRATDDTMVTL